MAVKIFPMAPARALISADPRQFGRGRMRDPGIAQQESWGLFDDAKLFAATFAAGFLFVFILIA
jgi:hypothetical protein